MVPRKVENTFHGGVSTVSTPVIQRLSCNIGAYFGHVPMEWNVHFNIQEGRQSW